MAKEKGFWENLLDGLQDESQKYIENRGSMAPEFRRMGKKAKNSYNSYSTKNEKIEEKNKRQKIDENKKKVSHQKTHTRPKKKDVGQEKPGPKIKMTKKEMKRAIIYSEIFGKPKSLR